MADRCHQQRTVLGDLLPELCIEGVSPVACLEADRGGSFVSTAQDTVLVDGKGLHGPRQWQADQCGFGDFGGCQFLPAGGSEEGEAGKADEE